MVPCLGTLWTLFLIIFQHTNIPYQFILTNTQMPVPLMGCSVRVKTVWLLLEAGYLKTQQYLCPNQLNHGALEISDNINMAYGGGEAQRVVSTLDRVPSWAHFSVCSELPSFTYFPCGFLLGFFCFRPTSQKHSGREIGCAELPVRVNECILPLCSMFTVHSQQP